MFPRRGPKELDPAGAGGENRLSFMGVDFGVRWSGILTAPVTGEYQLGAIGMLPTLDLGKLGDDAPVASIEVTLDSSALRLDPEAAFGLFARGNPVVSDETPMRHHFPAPITFSSQNVDNIVTDREG